MEEKIKNAQKLCKDINKNLNKNEYNCRSFKGVKNLSVSDLESIKLYAEHFLKYKSFRGLMTPLGNEKKVLIKYKLLPED